VGKVTRYRRRRLRGLDEFEPRQRIRFWPQPKRRRGRALLFAARPFALFAILAGIWVGMDPALVEPPGFLTTEPEQVAESFTRCGPGRGHACVIDGDTFKLGERKVRIIGIDAPEAAAQCPEEALQAEAATSGLQALLNQGPFEMVAPLYGRTDRYGRDLRLVRRTLPDGSSQSIAAEMRESGLARRYFGGLRGGWC